MQYSGKDGRKLGLTGEHSLLEQFLSVSKLLEAFLFSLQ